MDQYSHDKWIGYAQASIATTNFILASDIDGTILGNVVGQAVFSAVCDRCRDDLRLVYVTGRRVDEVRRLVNEGVLPQPEIIIGSVGTDIYDWNSNSHAIASAFLERIQPTWDLQSIYKRGVGPGVSPQHQAI